MAKRPKRKIDSQILLFDVEEFTTGSTEEVLFEDDVFDDLEEIFDETNPTDVGLITNEIYCGDTVETMKKINDKSINLKEIVDRFTDHETFGSFASRISTGEQWAGPKNGGKDDRAHPPIHPVKSARKQELDGLEW